MSLESESHDMTYTYKASVRNISSDYDKLLRREWTDERTDRHNDHYIPVAKVLQFFIVI